MQVQSLGWEYPLEEEIATHFSIFAWEILWTEEPGGLPSMGFHKSQIQLSKIAVAIVQCQHWCLQALLWKFSSSLLAGAYSICQGACSSCTCQTCNQPCWDPAPPTRVSAANAGGKASQLGWGPVMPTIPPMVAGSTTAEEGMPLTQGAPLEDLALLASGEPSLWPRGQLPKTTASRLGDVTNLLNTQK